MSIVPVRLCSRLRSYHSILHLSSVRGFSSRKEEVIGVWIFHRHGDRTPGRPLVADNCIKEESAFWETKIPPLDRTHYNLLSKKFPVKIHPNNNGGKFLDADSGRQPYGFLTWKGMQQLYEIGQKLSERYALFRDKWHIQAFSTNYLRTVMSSQCLLDGMFSSVAKHHESQYETRDLESYIKSSSDPSIEIVVRDAKDETLNTFDTSPILMKRLVRNIIDSPNFINHDTKAVLLVARLSNYIPALIKLRSPYGGPSGINWIHAADHFICRHSHGIPLTRFLSSDFEKDSEAERTLQAMKHATISHLASRFRYWYQSPSLIAAMVGPLFSDVNAQMGQTINTPNSSRKPFNVYSCHDVTILALLYGIGADMLATPNELKDVGVQDFENEKRLRYWPGYASTLILELIKVETVDREDEFLIKFILDEQNIRTITGLRKGEDMRLSDFDELVHRINQAYPHQ